MAEEYTEQFFQALREGVARSAEVMVPIVVELTRPASVVDVGCGAGGWLAAFARHGVRDYLGIDGYAPEELLEIPRDRFLAADLTRPLALDRTFDLAISLEVAEHLAGSAARTFVESLTRLAPVVMFSAAVPGQGGTGHRNEQWPRYWADLFADLGFDALDVVRPRVWDDERIEPWYAQNTVLYAARRPDGRRRDLDLRPGVTSGAPLALVHPRLFAERDGALAQSRQACASATAELREAHTALATAREQHRAEAERLDREIRRLRVRADPRNMSLRAYARALPHVVGGALRRAVRRIGHGQA
jgi:SAM-dependent methyltransferase